MKAVDLPRVGVCSPISCLFFICDQTEKKMMSLSSYFSLVKGLDHKIIIDKLRLLLSKMDFIRYCYENSENSEIRI